MLWNREASIPVTPVSKNCVVAIGRDVVHTRGAAWIRFQMPNGVSILPRRNRKRSPGLHSV